MNVLKKIQSPISLKSWLITVAIVSSTIFALMVLSQKATAAPPTDHRLWVAECSDIRGNITVYRGPSSAFNFTSDNYLKIYSGGYVYRYPYHMCTITQPQ